jgi:hypothetical protein
MPIDRRHNPRIEILGRLHGHTVALDVAVNVREISLGGMAVQTSVPLVVGAVHGFLLTLGDGSTVELSGTVIHTRRVGADDDAPEPWVSGIQFIDDEEDAADVIEKVR